MRHYLLQNFLYVHTRDNFTNVTVRKLRQIKAAYWKRYPPVLSAEVAR